LNLILIGYRGTGKSSVGRIVAERLGRPFVSLDEEIVRQAGMTIPEIVRRHSWDYFRDLESERVAHFASKEGQVLDTGGGVVIRPINVEHLRRKGILFLLEAGIEEIAARISDGTERPSLTGTKSFTEEVEEVLSVRQPLYRNAAHHVIDTSKLSVDEVASEIIGRFII
jgi:shikimate kinase